MAKEEVSMSMKQKCLEWLGEVVGHVNGCVNPIEEDEVAFNPFT